MSRYDSCELCRDIRGLEVHHKIPLSIGGDDSLENLIVVCSRCHGTLHNGTRKILQRAGIKKTQEKEVLRKKAIAFYENLEQMRGIGDVCDYLDKYVFEIDERRGK